MARCYMYINIHSRIKGNYIDTLVPNTPLYSYQIEMALHVCTVLQPTVGKIFIHTTV